MTNFPIETTLQSESGADLAVYHQPAEAAPTGIVVISHGLAEHARRYARFAAFLSLRGYAVYAYDHRGHGETKASDAPLGSFAGTEGMHLVLQDTETVIQYARTQHPNTPLISFGHSMGGLVVLNHAMSFPSSVTALAIWNSNFNGGAAGRAAQGILKIERMFLGSDVPSRMLPKLTFSAWARSIKKRRTEFDWLSHDEAEVDKYINDPLCGFDASVGMWQDVFRMIFRGGDFERLKRLPKDLSVHLIGGGQDPATMGGAAVTWLAKRMRNVGMIDVTGRIYDGFRHETLNETDRQGAMEDFVAWAERVIKVR